MFCTFASLTKTKPVKQNSLCHYQSNPSSWLVVYIVFGFIVHQKHTLVNQFIERHWCLLLRNLFVQSVVKL